MEQDELLRRALDILEGQRITYFIVGSLASSVYGEPRFTQDIDIVIDLQREQIARLCQAFPAPEFYVSEPAAREAVMTHGQFNVIHPTSGQKIDFMIVRKDDWGRSQLERRRREEIVVGYPGFMAAPEDVILAKLWYYQDGGSEKHLRDIAAMLQVSGEIIDTAYIDRWAEKLGYSQEWKLVLERVRKRT